MASVAPSARSREEDLVALLRSAQPVTDLPVRVATFLYGEPASTNLKVVVSTEADAATGAPDVLLGYVLIDGQGVIAASGAQRASEGRRAFSATLPPGNYTLRVGGIDPLGRRGLVQRRFTATLATQSDMRLSDVILAPVPHAPDAPLEPLIDRIDATRLSVYLEAYAAGPDPLADLQVSFDIVPADALTPILTQSATVTRHGTRWAAARAELALDGIATGPYLAIARVTDGSRELARAARRFTRTPP
jgi:hypothetical protein